MSSVYNVNLNWFLLGEGSPFETEKATIRLLHQEAATGRGREIEDYAEENILKLPRSLINPYRPENLQAVYVAGDSMIGEHIYNGDAVIFYLGLTEGNGVYVLSMDTALLVKRVSFDDPPSVSIPHQRQPRLSSLANSGGGVSRHQGSGAGSYLRA